MDFNLSKQNTLTKNDKSHEQKWDKKIIPLCNKINSQPNFYTTSSCSGRITIIKTTLEKIPNAFLFKSHEKISSEQIIKILNKLEKNQMVYFKQEPCALHIASKNLENAQVLLNKARQIGWKKSGIISSNKRFVCELFSTEIISTPLTKNTSKDYLKLLIGEANKKLERTWGKIDKLSRIIS